MKIGFLKKLRDRLDRSSLSLPVQKALFQESVNGVLVANRLRILLFILFTILVAIISHEKDSFDPNWIVVCLFGLSTVFQAFFLKRFPEKTLKFNSFFVAFDFLIIFIMIVFQSETADGFDYVLLNKNSNFWILTLFIVLQSLQLRLGPVLFSVLLVIGFQVSIALLALYHNVETTSDYTLFHTGHYLNLMDALLKRPFIILSLGVILTYLVYRTIVLVRKLSSSQSHIQRLSRYFSPKVIEDISKNPDILSPGKRQKVTILMNDIRGFTRLSEEIPPDELVIFLNDYRRRMAEVILKNGGSIDKFIGDAIMATFGTPVPSPVPGEDNRNALKAGIEMFQCLNQLNIDREKKGNKKIKMGIGIHCGEVIAGNIGEDALLEYTVIGDPVNTTARIEEQCKVLDKEFLISEDIFNDIKNYTNIKPLVHTKLKGKEKPVLLYEVDL